MLHNQILWDISPIGSFMSNPFVSPFAAASSCSDCPSTMASNDDTSCSLTNCTQTDGTTLNTVDCFCSSVFCNATTGRICDPNSNAGNGLCKFQKLPDGNGGSSAGDRIGDTLNRIVDDWMDANKRPGIEVIYGPIGDWDVSSVTNFRYLFF